MAARLRAGRVQLARKGACRRPNGSRGRAGPAAKHLCKCGAKAALVIRGQPGASSGVLAQSSPTKAIRGGGRRAAARVQARGLVLVSCRLESSSGACQCGCAARSASALLGASQWRFKATAGGRAACRFGWSVLVYVPAAVLRRCGIRWAPRWVGGPTQGGSSTIVCFRRRLGPCLWRPPRGRRQTCATGQAPRPLRGQTWRRRSRGRRRRRLGRPALFGRRPGGSPANRHLKGVLRMRRSGPETPGGSAGGKVGVQQGLVRGSVFAAAACSAVALGNRPAAAAGGGVPRAPARLRRRARAPRAVQRRLGSR